MTPYLLTPAAESPVSLTTFKSHLRIPVDDVSEDALLQSYLSAAVSYLDGWRGVLGRCIVSQTWRHHPQSLDAQMRLPMPDASAFSITYLDSNDTVQTLSAATYKLSRDSFGPLLWADPDNIPDVSSDRDAVTLDVTYGFGAASDVPAGLQELIYMLAAHYEQNREAVSSAPLATVPLGFEELLANWRWVNV